MTEYFKQKNIKVEIADEKAHMANIKELDLSNSQGLSEDSRDGVNSLSILTNFKQNLYLFKGLNGLEKKRRLNGG
jgi:hypothetical protein